MEDPGKEEVEGGPIKWEALVELRNTSHDVCRGSCSLSMIRQQAGETTRRWWGGGNDTKEGNYGEQEGETRRKGKGKP